MNNGEIIEVINKIGDITLKIAGSNFANISSVKKLIDKMKEIIAPSIYSQYEEFFNKFSDFCVQCDDEKYLSENREMLESSIQLFAECLDEIANTYSKPRICSCCGQEVFYLPIDNYYAEMAKNYGTPKSVAETLSSNEYFCPSCKSSDRDRMIIEFLKKIGLKEAQEDLKVLQIAPAVTIEGWIESYAPQVDYESTDLFMEGVSFKSDIQNMDNVKDETYDVIICSHVLEHVQDDKKAFLEMKRVLKADGIVVFLVPIDLSSNVIDEEWGLSEEENWKRFGQGDHCRKYGKSALINRIKDCGLYINSLGIDYFGQETFEKLGLTATSVLYALTKDEAVKLDKHYEMTVSKDIIDKGPLVSVIMSCYNHGAYVAETIESVINQSYKNIEFIVADDASTDNSVEVMKKYSQYFTKETYYSNNQGGRLLELLSDCKGKYIALINSDDVWEKDKIALQVEYLEKHLDTGAVFTWATYTDENLNSLSTTDFLIKNHTKYEWMKRFWCEGNALCYPSIVIRMEDYKNIIAAGTGCRQLFDFFMWVELVQHKDIYVVPKTMVKMRRYSNQKVKNMSATTKENIVRNIVEEMAQWMYVIENMNLEYFKAAFSDFFRNKEAVTKEELISEKFFFMLDNPKKWIQNNGIMYFFKICKDEKVKKCLEDEYGFTLKKFFEINSKNGFSEYIKNML